MESNNIAAVVEIRAASCISKLTPMTCCYSSLVFFYETTLPAFSKASSNLSAAQQSMGTFFKSPLQSLEIAQVDDLLLSQFMITVHSHMKELKGMVMT